MVVKTFEIISLPVRTGKFIARKNWFIIGSDDLQLRVFNYNTYERITSFDAHSDYIRCVIVHSSKPYVLSCSDDLTIKLWDWQSNWSCIRTFDGHMHYVMQLCLNPKDTNMFASCSLDRTIKVWNLSSSTPNYTLDGHEKGVCAVAYYPGIDKPYLASGGDDKQIRLWDSQNKSCIQVLQGHMNSITSLLFHPTLPILFSGAEDETFRVWNMNNFRLENSYQYGFERIWYISALKEVNLIALACDRGTIGIQIGRDEPVMSMDISGKVIWTKNTEIFTSTIRQDSYKNGEQLILSPKELGQCDLYPTQLKHSPNGRFVTAIGGGEYIIYTALAWRNKTFGSAIDFAWSSDSNYYAVQESSKILIFKNFSLHRTIHDSSSTMFGGPLLSIWKQSDSLLYFYNWDDGTFVRRIDVSPKSIYWSENGSFLAIVSERDGFFILSYNPQVLEAYQEQGISSGEDGMEEAFQVVSEQSNDVSNGIWIGDHCFVFVANKLCYYIGGQIYTISAQVSSSLYILGYLPKHEQIYLANKECQVYSYYISMFMLEYQRNILEGNLDAARSLLPNISSIELVSLAKFLESQGHIEEALNVTTDDEHKFTLALTLKRMDIAIDIATNQSNIHKWKILALTAKEASDIPLLCKCLEQSHAYADLLLLYHAMGDMHKLLNLSEHLMTRGDFNIAFIAAFLANEKKDCFKVLMESGKYCEAAFFARSYCPELTIEAFKKWQDTIKQNVSDGSLKVDYSSLLQVPATHSKTGQFDRMPSTYPIETESIAPVDQVFAEHNSTISDGQSMEVNTTGTGSIREDFLGSSEFSGETSFRSPFSISQPVEKASIPFDNPNQVIFEEEFNELNLSPSLFEKRHILNDEYEKDD